MRLACALAACLVASTAAAEKAPGPTRTRGTLLDDSTPAAHCGSFEVWTIVHFDTSADPDGPRGTKVDPKRIPVAIPCAELPRPRYDKRAGTAGVRVKGKRYVLELDNPRAAAKWGNRLAWVALRIDDAP
jgi:hypothetical protein